MFHVTQPVVDHLELLPDHVVDAGIEFRELMG